MSFVARLPFVVSAYILIAGFVGAPVHAQNGPTSVAPLAKKLSDAVVNISTSQTVKGPQGVPLPKVPKGSPFEEFFDDFLYCLFKSVLYNQRIFQKFRQFCSRKLCPFNQIRQPAAS